MTLLAGYDVMTEIRASLVADLLEASLVLPGVGNVRTPFEYATSLVVSEFPIDIRVVVASIDLDLQTGRPLTVEVRFTSGTLSNGSLRISPIEGVIRAAFDHRIDIVAGVAVLVLRPRDEDSDVQLSENSIRLVYAGTEGWDIPAETAQEGARLGLGQMLRGAGEIALPIGIAVTPGIDGGIMPSLVYAGLDAIPYGSADRAGQLMLLAGYFFAGNVGRGNVGGKDQVAIPADQQIAVSMSPSAFRRFCFCPSLMEGLMPSTPSWAANLPPAAADLALADYRNGRFAKLPSACSGAEEIEVQDGLRLTKVEDKLSDGEIILDLGFYTTGFCYKASGTVRAYLGFTVEDNMLVPSTRHDEPDVGVSIPWYCWISAWVVGKIYAVAALGIANIVATVAADGIADGLVGSALADNIRSTGIGQVASGPLSVTFRGVDIKPDRFTLFGNAAIAMTGRRGQVSMHLEGGAGDPRVISQRSGFWLTKIYCESKDDIFPWRVDTQVVPYSYSVVTTMLPALQCSFFLRFFTPSGQKEYKLDPKGGTLTVADVPVDFPLPLPLGGTHLVKEVAVNYRVDGQSIHLENRPEDGNYRMDLLVRDFRDLIGNPVPATVTVLYAGINVDGERLSIFNDYQERVTACIIGAAREAMKDPDIREGIIIRDDINEPVPGHVMTPETIVDLFEKSVFSGLPQSRLEQQMLQLATIGGTAAARGPNVRSLQSASLKGRIELVRKQALDEIGEAIRTLGNGALRG